MTDSEEVEKVLQSLASESGNSESTDGDPDRDKVEELLRQLEQEKEYEAGGEDADQANDKPKPASRSITKKPNGSAKVGDKPAAPKKVSLMTPLLQHIYKTITKYPTYHQTHTQQITSLPILHYTYNAILISHIYYTPCSTQDIDDDLTYRSHQQEMIYPNLGKRRVLSVRSLLKTKVFLPSPALYSLLLASFSF